MQLHDLNNATYIALETFRKNGKGVVTPVWLVAEHGKLYVWTAADSGKVKRIRNHDRVRVCQCNSRGKPQSEWVEAKARIMERPQNMEATGLRMAAKYGLMFRAIGWLGRITRRTAKRAVLEITTVE